MMTLAGLVMALVVLIDDAVVGVDNSAHRLREQRAVGNGGSLRRAIIDATLEMRGGMLFATLIVLAALVPAFFIQGEAGAFLPSIVITYVLAVAVSMLVALMVTPALSVMLLANAPLARRESPVVRLVQGGYTTVAGLVARPRRALVVFGAVVVVGLVAVPFLDLSLRPSLRERRRAGPSGCSTRHVSFADGRDCCADHRGAAIRPGRGGRGSTVGRAVMSDQIVNVNSAEIWINIDRSADYGATLAAIQDAAEGSSDVSSDVLTYSEQRIKDVLHSKTTRSSCVSTGRIPRCCGPGRRIQGVLGDIEGVDSPQVQLADEPTLEVEVDLARAQAVGIKPGDVRRQAATLLGGMIVGNLFEQQRVFDVVVWGTPAIRQSADQVGALLIEAPGGRRVRLDEVADVRLVPNQSVVRHESVERYVDVTAGVAGRSAGDVLADVKSSIPQVEFPFEHHAELLGGFEEQQSARARALSVAVAAAIGIFLLFQAAFASWRLAAIVFVTLPMALVGASSPR